MSLEGLSLRPEYRTGEDDLLRDFYLPCLQHSIAYDRAAGYFRSTLFLAVGDGLLDFARRGGRVRLVCSPELSEEDVRALESGYEERERIVERALAREIESILSRLDTRDGAATLATLVAIGNLDIRIALRPEAYGIFHEKLGIFSDTLGAAVSFVGSSNETWSGWHAQGNHESFEVYGTWRGPSERERVQRHRSYFERLWQGRVPCVDTLPFPDVSRELLTRAAAKDLDSLAPVHSRQSTKSLLPHQNAAIEAWIRQDRRGILEHSTGSGKTITAIHAVREHLKTGPALIMVPSELLLQQWSDVLKEEIPGAAVLLAGGGHDNWRKPGRLQAFTAARLESDGRVTLATIQTAAADDFRRRLAGGAHLLVICDEVHRAGSPFSSQVLQVNAGPRLGLSATPRRFGDPLGTSKIFDYFGPVVPPPFTLEDAIQAGRLVPYEYYPHLILLSEQEEQQWQALAERIRRSVAMSSHLSEADAEGARSQIKHLLIRRSRIAKKADSKIQLASRVLRESYAAGDRWIVYCEDREQLGQVRSALTQVQIESFEYHAEMQAARKETLAWFERYGGVIVSIRCLDEGVDIPAATHALILASSRNPREFIQRRGRLLRTDPERPWKKSAAIHDALVVPKGTGEEANATALTRSELARAVQFARSAKNVGAQYDLMRLAVDLGIDPTELSDTGLEDDDDDGNG
jgi:superfamily II DNA or RNA helicase